MKVTVVHPRLPNRRRTLPPDKAERFVAAGWTVDQDPECWCEPEEAVYPPTGTIPEVLAWVDDDQGRAAAALEVERAESARPTLIARLETITDTPEGGEGDDL